MPHAVKATVLPLFAAARFTTDMAPDQIEAIMRGPPLTLYRGVHDKRYARGMSWTRSPERAQWFAQRFNKNGTHVVVSSTMEPSTFLGAFVGRGEDEVVLNPRRIKEIKIEEEA